MLMIMLQNVLQHSGDGDFILFNHLPLLRENENDAQNRKRYINSQHMK